MPKKERTVLQPFPKAQRDPQAGGRGPDGAKVVVAFPGALAVK